MLEWKSYHTVTDDSVIRAVEQRIGRRLPQEYVDVAMQYSGGAPMPRVFTVCEQEIVFNRLISVAPDRHPNLLDALAWAEDAAGPRLVPFATDVFGNLICFSCPDATAYYSIVWRSMEDGGVIPFSLYFPAFLDSLRPPRGGGRP